jgi:hypothetical protein
MINCDQNIIDCSAKMIKLDKILANHILSK